MPKDLPEKVVKMGTAFNEIGWVMPLVGFAELLGGLLLIIPKTRALGAVILFPVMIGILLTHILVAPSGLPLAMIIFAILLGIIFDNRKKYLPMIQ